MAIAETRLGLPPEALVLPSDRVESLRAFLPRVEAMRDRIARGDWPHFSAEYEINDAMPKLQERVSELFAALGPYKPSFGPNSNWEAAMRFTGHTLGEEMLARDYNTWNRLRGDVERVGKEIDLESVWPEIKLWRGWFAYLSHAPGRSLAEVKDPTPYVFKERLQFCVGDVFNAAKNALVWEALKGNELGPNPFLAEFSLYELGVARVSGKYLFPEGSGVHTRESVLTLDVPFSRDGKVLACLVFPEDRPGDEEVKFYHGWATACENAKPLIIPHRSLS